MVEKVEVENRNSALCYVPFFGWMPAIVFLVTEKDAKVRWNAMQSLLLHAALAGVYWIALPLIRATIVLAPLAWLLGGLVGVVFFVAALVMASKAFHGERTRIPVISEWVDKLVK